ncbi:MAG TPA: hypothetical protein VLF67_05000 [Candidatus Saccharimonas sp.]|nr:hypothetical protein [Candidatus Saccharimonas sp.]
MVVIDPQAVQRLERLRLMVEQYCEQRSDVIPLVLGYSQDGTGWSWGVLVELPNNRSFDWSGRALDEVMGFSAQFPPRYLPGEQPVELPDVPAAAEIAEQLARIEEVLDGSEVSPSTDHYGELCLYYHYGPTSWLWRMEAYHPAQKVLMAEGADLRELIRRADVYFHRATLLSA